jgi:hypothetical protein
VRATLGPAAWTPLQEGDENDKRRDTLKGLIETEPGGAQELYEKALEYFCLADRPLPERLEISLLEDDCGRYGFFVESPEPIPWKLNEPGRVSLTIGKAVGDIVSPVPAYGPVKLIGCEISGITGTDQVDLLIQTDADLAGYRIEQVNNEGDGALYYEFSAGSQFQAGAVLHIHAGEPPAVASAGIGQKDLYGAIAGTVIEGGPTLRLCDADGREIHRRQFGTVLSESYDMVTTDADATQTFVLGPDADGTRTFIFLREKQDDGQCWLDALPDGVYRFDWTFKRDTGDEKLPVLRRCGVTTAEEASIEFNVPAELPDCATS